VTWRSSVAIFANAATSIGLLAPLGETPGDAGRHVIFYVQFLVQNRDQRSEWIVGGMEKRPKLRITKDLTASPEWRRALDRNIPTTR
jgi:hypothetical protein